MFRFLAPAAVVTALSTLAFAGCSSDDSPAPSGQTDSGTAAADSATGADSGGTTSKTVNGCSSYTDGTAVAWGITVKPPATCLRVKKGGSVTFTGDFTVHPLAAKDGDSAGSPFATTTSSGAAKEFKFDTAGTFGFVCTNHSTMTGAVEVTP